MRFNKQRRVIDYYIQKHFFGDRIEKYESAFKDELIYGIQLNDYNKRYNVNPSFNHEVILQPRSRYIPEYSTKIYDTWKIVEELRKRNLSVDIMSNGKGDEYDEWIVEIANDNDAWIGVHKDVEMAICQAAINYASGMSLERKLEIIKRERNNGK